MGKKYSEIVQASYWDSISSVVGDVGAYSKACILVWLMLGIFVVNSNSVHGSMGTTAHLQATIYQENYTTKPGDTLWLAVDIHITPEWHIYWQNPGDSGSAGEIEWALPPGIKVGDIQWPTPSRIAMPPLMNYGYEQRVTWLLPFLIGEKAELGELEISGTFFWLVCKEECIPESTEIYFTIYTDQETIAQDSYQAFFSNARTNLPKALLWKATAKADEKAFTLNIQLPAEDPLQLKDLYFYPDTFGVALHAAEQIWVKRGDTVQLTIPRDTNHPIGEKLTGILSLAKKQGESLGFKIDHAIEKPKQVTAGLGSQNGVSSSALNAGVALLMAFVGGIILNFMPCVFPVLSIKLLSLVKHGGQSRSDLLKHGFIYTAGVTSTFLAVGVLLLLLRAGGAEIGWGFQLQSPLVVITLVYLFLLLGLIFAGVISLNLLVSISEGERSDSSFIGAFSGGVLAVIVASPCTVPFMGAAIGYAVTQNTGFALPIFAVLGLGMAVPYLLLCYFPGWLNKLPSPGQWMVNLQRFMAFPMFATALWLLWVLAQQVSMDLVFHVLLGLLSLTLVLWLWQLNKASGVKNALGISACVTVITGLAFWHNNSAQLEAAANQEESWQSYNAQTLQSLLDDQKAVFVNFTAAWCITCQVNEKLVLSKPEIQQLFQENNVTYIKGDWTQQDAAITQMLTKYGRSGVPLYLYFSAEDQAQPIVLPEILTEEIVKEVVLASS